MEISYTKSVSKALLLSWKHGTMCEITRKRLCPSTPSGEERRSWVTPRPDLPEVLICQKSRAGNPPGAPLMQLK